jgi:hypothetical protein
MTIALDFDIKDKNIIVWRGQVVMSRSEAPYFEMLFARVAKHMHASRVLEIGFGLGISANLIQRYLQPVAHHIVEIDEAIGADLNQFASHHASVMPIIGDWTSAELDAPYDFVFFDPFDYFEKTENESKNEMQLLHDLVGESGVLCHPHFGDGEPRQLIGFRNVVLERLEVPRITMADGTHCEHCAVVLCYPTS